MHEDHSKCLISLLDLTSLNETDTPETIKALCKKAQTPVGPVAAVCIYPAFVKQAKALLESTPIKIATVSNFPSGMQPIDENTKEIQQAIADGADEIDWVIPYPLLMQQQASAVMQALKTIREISKTVTLKIILETGKLDDPELIAEASTLAIEAGADFIKTSTGKVEKNATLSAAAIMLQQIKQHHQEKTVGFKAAGGIRTVDEAMRYIALAEKIMGANWVSPQNFRIGASRLPSRHSERA